LNYKLGHFYKVRVLSQTRTLIKTAL